MSSLAEMTLRRLVVELSADYGIERFKAAGMLTHVFRELNLNELANAAQGVQSDFLPF